MSGSMSTGYGSGAGVIEASSVGISVGAGSRATVVALGGSGEVLQAVTAVIPTNTIKSQVNVRDA